MEFNPYAAPQSQVFQATSEDELARRSHINTEAAIKSVGTLYYIGTLVLLLVGGVTLVRVTTDSNNMGRVMHALLISALIMSVGVGLGMVGYGLKHLRSWTRIPTVIISCLGLFAYPVGTLIFVYILVQVLGEKGQFVMTPEYQRIIAATPNVKRKTSMVTWVLLILFIIILIGVIAAVNLRQ
jgi:uncharacterized membrane protein